MAKRAQDNLLRAFLYDAIIGWNRTKSIQCPNVQMILPMSTFFSVCFFVK